MKNIVTALCLCLLIFGIASGQSIEGKKIVVGHGRSFLTTWNLRQHIDEIKSLPIDGVLIHVNRNDWAGDNKLREVRPARWFSAPGTRIEDFSIALDDLANTDMGQLKHNILWTSGFRSFAVDWFDDERWESVICNDARVMGEVVQRGGFEAVWFDVEYFNKVQWKGTGREQKAPFEQYAAKVRQCARKWMEAFVAGKPDIKLLLSHGYGSAMINIGSDVDRLPESIMGLLPAFIDGLIEGCGDQAKVINSGEKTYGYMTYPGFRAMRRWEEISADALSQVPSAQRKKSYGLATALWPDFEARSSLGWHEDDLEKNHLSPERLKHAFHNAMAASDEYVWTYCFNVHFWPSQFPAIWGVPPNQSIQELRKIILPTPHDTKGVFNDQYIAALAAARETMDLDWHPGQTSEPAYETPVFDTAQVCSQIGEGYREILNLSDNWLFHPADSSTTFALDWGVSLYIYGHDLEQVYDFRPVRIDDYWENQGIGLDGIGVYRRRFCVPETARDDRLILALAGVAGRATLYVARKGQEAQRVGRTEGPTLTLFDLSEVVDRQGDNYLTIVVQSPEGPGGIYGMVRLLAGTESPPTAIEIYGDQTGAWRNNAGDLVPIYDWQTGKGGEMIPRDVPRLNAKKEIQSRFTSKLTHVKGERFQTELTLSSSDEARWGWPAVTIKDPVIKDWSEYAGLAIKLHNPTDRTQRIGISVRDSDHNIWLRIEDFAPGETKTHGATLDQLRAKVLVSDIWTVTVYGEGPKEAQIFCVSPIFLIKGY